MQKRTSPIRNGLLAIAGGLLLSLPLTARADELPPAAAATPVTPPESAPLTENGEKLVCHTMSHQGSLVRVKVCKTQKQWDIERAKMQREFSGFQNRSYTAPPR